MKKILVFLLCFVLCFATLTVFIAAEEPGAEDPGAVVEPGAEDPGAAEQPGAEDPGAAEQPGAEDPGAAEQPGAEDPGAAEQPGAEDPGASDDPSYLDDLNIFDIVPGEYTVVFPTAGLPDAFAFDCYGSINDTYFSYIDIGTDGVIFWETDMLDSEVAYYGKGEEFTVTFIESTVSNSASVPGQAQAVFFQLFPDAQPTSSSTGLIPGIFGIFTSIISWISLALTTVVSLFWSNGSLTFFGLLAVVALGISLFFLLIGLCQRFLHFRS